MASSFAGARFGATRYGRRDRAERPSIGDEHAELRAAVATTQGVLVNPSHGLL